MRDRTWLNAELDSNHRGEVLQLRVPHLTCHDGFVEFVVSRVIVQPIPDQLLPNSNLLQASQNVRVALHLVKQVGDGIADSAFPLTNLKYVQGHNIGGEYVCQWDRMR